MSLACRQFMWDREAWDEFCERSIAALVLGAVVLNAVFFGGVDNPEIGLIILAALGIWLFRLWLNPSHRLLLHPVLVPGLAFVGYAAWLTQRAPVAHWAEKEWMQVALAALTFVLSYQNLQRQEIARWVTHTLVAVGCLIAGYAILQLLRESDAVLWLQQPLGYAKRSGGTFVNPNHLAGFLSILIPVAFAVVFLGRESSVIKILHGYAALVMLGGVAVSMSRGGWAATAFGLTLLVSWIAWRRRELRLPIGATALILIVAGVWYVEASAKAQARLANIGSSNNLDSGASRLWIWRPAYAMWRDHPLTGVGPAHFDVLFPAYRPWQIQAHAGWTHNEYLGLLVDYGAIGAGLGVAALAAFVWGLVRTNKYVERGVNDLGQRLSNRAALYVGSVAGLGAVGFHCVVDFDLHIPAIQQLVALLGGLLAAHIRFATDGLWMKLHLWSRGLLTLAGLAVLAWIGPRLVTAGQEAYHLNQARRATQVDSTLMAHLRSAADLAPGNPRTPFELGENLRRLSFNGDREWRTNAVQATQWLERSLALNPRDPEAWLALARTHQWMGDTGRASVEFDRALALGTNSVEVANHVAWNLLTRGRTNEAKALFDKSVQWNWYNNPMAISQKAELEAKGYK